MKLIGVLLLAAVMSLFGVCGGSDKVASKDTRTAAQVVSGFKQAGLPIGNTVDYDVNSDPDKLLGRPGQYISKSNFRDSRIPALELFGIDVQMGGSVEVFTDNDVATQRKNYLEGIGKIAPFLVEYDYQYGHIILRLSRTLTPDQAEAYNSNLKSSK